MLSEPFSEGLCIPQMGAEDPNGLINKDEITDQQCNQQLGTVADVICGFSPSHDQRDVVAHNAQGKRKIPVEHKGRVRWSSDDTLVLVNAKLMEKNMHSANSAIKRTKSAIEKWRTISAHCHENGLDRNATQCRDRWKHILPDYKKIRHYERNLTPDQVTYWDMTPKERMDKRLPTNYTRELYDAMGKHFGQKGNNSGDMIIDTSASDHAAFDDCQATKLSIMHESLLPDTSMESPGTSSDRDNNYTGMKRKTSSKGSGIKTNLSESYKMILSSLKSAEEGRMKRHERYCNLFERRMEMDEKYLNHHAMNMQRMIHIEEQKVKAQHDLAAALSTIGQAILKIYESLDR
eukprot:TRINITY_DN5970_c0_g1_i2.p1 TRINITY_DN5970_c0_g1~~TRINITY_DN5970_c0_g1_i2.p1  ORF type:complete len:348 (+),score=68.28 TRINITY_DN5970_c0_g1_i2:310-1353(+)